MNILSDIEIFNAPAPNKTADLKPSKPITILTGYNGVGKSTILSIIHSTISELNSSEYNISRSNWACKATISSGQNILTLKIEDLNRINPLDFIKEINTKDINARTAYSTAEKLYGKSSPKPEKKGTPSFLKKENKDKTNSKDNISFLFGPKTADPETNTFVRSALYSDEALNFNKPIDNEEKLEELKIFSQQKTLDRTLYLLLIEYSSTVKRNGTSQFNEIIKILTTMEETASKLENKRKIREQIEAIKSIAEPEAEHIKLINEANKFFSSTHREAFINEKNIISLRVTDSENKKAHTHDWFDLSKGEKNLLCLLLAAHLYNDKKMVFLFDEPDLSLHIRWQKQILPSLRELAPDSQFIIATHSPAMVGNTDCEEIVNISKILKD